MNTNIHLFGFILAIWTSVSSGSVVETKLSWEGLSHNEQCSESESCSGNKWLSCQNGRCLCTEREEMLYDLESSQCTALAGFSCLRKLPGADPDNPDRYYINCVPNAKCTYPEDECQCEFRYYQIANRTCIHQKPYGRACAADRECDQFKFLSCIDGTCQCDKSHRYDKKSEKCIVTVGSSCKTIDYVSIKEDKYRGDECPEHAACRNEVCTCEEGFTVSADKLWCGREYDNHCDLSERCSDIQFSCRSHKCQCKYPLHQYYDKDLGQCVSLVTGPCTNTGQQGTSNGCTTNAVCQESNVFSFCKCSDGYVETNDGHCVKAFGSSCEYDSDCDDLAPLACIENMCNCPDKLQMFDEKVRKCIGLVGARCSRDTNSTFSACTPNSFCVKSNPLLNYGICLCVRGFMPSPSRTCIKSP